jgi:tRNA pseudouridine55 synthase
VSQPGPDGVLLLDKPEGFSSTQALARCKRFLAARKAGHTGTLDPFATGLLPLVFGEATKFSRFLIDAAKGYTATLRLGVESSTGDPEGVLTQPRPVHVSPAQVDQALESFLGSGEQVPPMHSAVRVGGQRLYDLARRGVEIERAARAIEILGLRRISLQGDLLVVDVDCSKGTYVRTLAVDIGRQLGCGAYLVGLRRTRVGRFRLESAVELAALEAEGVAAARERLLPLEVLVAELPRLDANADLAWRFGQGQAVALQPDAPAGEIAVFGPGGRFIGVGRREAPGPLSPVRLLAGAGSGQIP